jgi:hypothetical protein
MAALEALTAKHCCMDGGTDVDHMPARADAQQLLLGCCTSAAARPVLVQSGMQ